MAQLLKPCIIIAIYALLLPVAGPLLDHHYVEWQHNHGHLYFEGGPEVERGMHTHVYDALGNHAHLFTTEFSGEQGLPEGVAYFASYDGSGSVPIYSPTSPTTGSLCFPDPGDCPLLLSYIASDVAPMGALTAPPQKPPTA